MGATANDYSDLAGLPSHANSVRWSEDNILAIAAGPTVHIAQPCTCPLLRCTETDGMPHDTHLTASLSQANAHVTREYTDFGPVEVDGGYHGAGNPINVLRYGAAQTAVFIVSSNPPRAAISRNNMLNTNYSNPSISTIAWSPPGVGPTCSAVLAVVGDDHTLHVYGPPEAAVATWSLHEDVGAALKRQLQDADWCAAGDLPPEEEPSLDEVVAMPTTPAAKPSKRGRKRKVAEETVEVVEEAEQGDANKEERPAEDASQVVDADDEPLPVEQTTPAAKKAKPAKAAKPDKEPKSAASGLPPTPEDGDLRELLDLPDKAIDNAEAFIPAAADAVLDYFKAQRMRGKRGRMPKYKPNEDLKFRDAETFPLAMAALMDHQSEVIEHLGVDATMLQEAAKEAVLAWVREVGPKPQPSKPRSKPAFKPVKQPVKRRTGAAARASSAAEHSGADAVGGRTTPSSQADRGSDDEEAGAGDPRLGWVKNGLDDPVTGAAAKMVNLKSNREGAMMKRPMASLFDSVLPPTAIHHRMSMLSITCAAWSPMCQGAGQQSHTLLLAGTADGWLWAWQRSAPTVYGNGQAPTPHVLVGGLRVTRAGIADVAVTVVPADAKQPDAQACLVVAIGCSDGAVLLMHAPTASMCPSTAYQPTHPLPSLPLTLAHTLSRATAPAPPLGMAAFNWGSLAVSCLALVCDASTLSLAIGAARGTVALYRAPLRARLDQALAAGSLAIAWEAHGWRMVTGVALAGGERVVSSGVDGLVCCHRWPSSDVPAGQLALLEPSDPPQLRDTSSRATGPLKGVGQEQVPCWGVAASPGSGSVLATVHTHRLYQLHLFKQLQIHKRLFRSRVMLQNLPPQLPSTTAALLSTPTPRLAAMLWELLLCVDDQGLDNVLLELDTVVQGGGDVPTRTKALQLGACVRRLRRRAAANGLPSTRTSVAAGPDVKAQDTQGDQSTAPSATAAASDDADHDPIASADAATMLRYAAQLATVGDDVALQSLQGYSQAPGFTAPLPALWATVCATMAELVEAMTGGASVLGDEPTKVAAALRARAAQGSAPPSLQASVLQNLPVKLLGPAPSVVAVVEDADGNHMHIPCCTATGLLIEGHAALQCGVCERLYAVAPVGGGGAGCVCCGVQLGGPVFNGQLHVPGVT